MKDLVVNGVSAETMGKIWLHADYTIGTDGRRLSVTDGERTTPLVELVRCDNSQLKEVANEVGSTPSYFGNAFDVLSAVHSGKVSVRARTPLDKVESGNVAMQIVAKGKKYLALMK